MTKKHATTEPKGIERLQPAMSRRWLLYFADSTVFDITFVNAVGAIEAASWHASCHVRANLLRVEPVQTWLN